MKLKDWGFMRHKPRRPAASRDRDVGPDEPQVEEEALQDIDSSATVEPMIVDPPQTHKEGGQQIVPDAELAEAEPTFMGMLHQTST
jgi:hypothetical protein